MTDFSKEIIEIDGTEYTLFLNRKGLIAWEKYCKTENEKLVELREKYENFSLQGMEESEVQEDTNPFDGLEEVDNVDEDAKLITKTFKRLYWIMFYTEHQLPVSKAEELYDKACGEYGEENLIKLANQMINDANTNLVEKEQLKNLAALRPANK